MKKSPFPQFKTLFHTTPSIKIKKTTPNPIKIQFPSISIILHQCKIHTIHPISAQDLFFQRCIVLQCRLPGLLHRAQRAEEARHTAVRVGLYQELQATVFPGAGGRDGSVFLVDFLGRMDLFGAKHDRKNRDSPVHTWIFDGKNEHKTSNKGHGSRTVEPRKTWICQALCGKGCGFPGGFARRW